MRLWDYRLIKLLPRSQLLSQWRELNSIYSNQPNHILIEYVYRNKKDVLYCYSMMVVKEMEHRHYKINKWDNFIKYFSEIEKCDHEKTFPEHDFAYLTICYFNLFEKYIRGQEDFTKEIWEKIHNLYISEKKKQLKG